MNPRYRVIHFAKGHLGQRALRMRRIRARGAKQPE